MLKDVSAEPLSVRVSTLHVPTTLCWEVRGTTTREPLNCRTEHNANMCGYFWLAVESLAHCHLSSPSPPQPCVLGRRRTLLRVAGCWARALVSQSLLPGNSPVYKRHSGNGPNFEHSQCKCIHSNAVDWLRSSDRELASKVKDLFV